MVIMDMFDLTSIFDQSRICDKKGHQRDISYERLLQRPGWSSGRRGEVAGGGETSTVRSFQKTYPEEVRTSLAETPECWITEFQLDSIFSCNFGHMIKL